MNLWIVGQYRESDNEEWEFQCVFDSEEKAIEYVNNRWGFFIGPCELNKPHPDERVDWEGAYYPHELNLGG